MGMLKEADLSNLKKKTKKTLQTNKVTNKTRKTTAQQVRKPSRQLLLM